MPVDHTIEAHIQVDASAVMAKQDHAAIVQSMVVDRMANAVLGGTLGADPNADLLALTKASETYVMVLTMLSALAELGIVTFRLE
jgi:hypothetical protein